jgi:hypothetical protein
MALHPNFPLSPYEVLPPDLRWFPAAEELRSTAYEKLLPPLVAIVLDQRFLDAARRDRHGYTGVEFAPRWRLSINTQVLSLLRRLKGKKRPTVSLSA